MTDKNTTTTPAEPQWQQTNKYPDGSTVSVSHAPKNALPKNIADAITKSDVNLANVSVLKTDTLTGTTSFCFARTSGIGTAKQIPLGFINSHPDVAKNDGIIFNSFTKQAPKGEASR
ncbi:MAG: hypothetical protein GY804_01520 [Alphaproteobacteria bacterium]|nr:hypothetical protein [Alphaproteobacteria bacterium]